MRVLVLLFFTLASAFSQGLLNPAVLGEIKLLSTELKEKTNIQTNVFISDEKSFNELKNEAISQKNFASIVISLKEKKLDVISDLDLDFRSVSEYYYLKYGFLPTQGAILPILTQPKGKDNVNAAVLNGFAELVDVIAKSKNIKLDNSLGNANDNIINTLRTLFYAFVIVFLAILIRRKIRKSNAE